jgi:hypothetical protein
MCRPLYLTDELLAGQALWPCYANHSHYGLSLLHDLDTVDGKSIQPSRFARNLTHTVAIC